MTPFALDKLHLVKVFHQFVVCVDRVGNISIVYLEKDSDDRSSLRLFDCFRSSSHASLSCHARPRLFEDSENEEMFMLFSGETLKLFNFEKILEEQVIQPHSIAETADDDFIQGSRGIKSGSFAEVRLTLSSLGLLSKIKYFKVGILVLCFDNGTLEFYNENTSRRILEYKVLLGRANRENGDLGRVVDVFPSYYAKKNKKDDLLTIIEGFNRMFLLNSRGEICILDFDDDALKVVGSSRINARSNRHFGGHTQSTEKGRLELARR